MSRIQANFILTTVSLVWGLSYVFMAMGIDKIEPANMVALRCGIAFIITSLIFRRKIIKVDIKTLSYSSIVGALLFGVFVMLVYGVQNTSATLTGFLTSTTVIIVPVILAIIYRKLPSKKITVGIGIVLIGLILMTFQGPLSFDLGAIYPLTAAFLYAIHIIASNKFVKRVDALLLGIYQLGFAAIFATIFSFIFETPVLPETSNHWIAILGLALICSAYGFVMQSIAQKYTTPESVGFLFSLEPIFSAIFAFIFLQEIIAFPSYIGAILIIVGVLIANHSGNPKSTKQREYQFN